MLKLVQNLLGDTKELQVHQNGCVKRIQWKYIEALNNVQENLGLSLANKLRKKHLLFFRNKMKVSLAAQTLSSSVATAIDYLRDEMRLPDFTGSEATTEFIRIIDRIFDMLNSRNPFAKGSKSPVWLQTLPNWLDDCKSTAAYLWTLRDREGKLVRENCRKTAIWGFVFSIHSLMDIATVLLTREQDPLKYVLTYKFSQDHIELLFSKIRSRGGHNNNPSVLQVKYALQSILVRNSIEPAKTGNCTHFEDALCQPHDLVTYSSQRHKSQVYTEEYDPETASCEKLLIEFDQEGPSEMLDNVLYYIGGYILQSLLRKVDCEQCKEALLLDTENPHGQNMVFYPLQAKFTCFKQMGGLLFPSIALLKILKAAEVIFRRRVIEQGKGICFDKNLSAAIQSAVVEQFGSAVFDQSQKHFFDHSLSIEADHLITLLRLVTEKYVLLCLKTYSKRFTEMVVHKNEPSLRHRLTKTILFKNQ